MDLSHIPRCSRYIHASKNNWLIYPNKKTSLRTLATEFYLLAGRLSIAKKITLLEIVPYVGGLWEHEPSQTLRPRQFGGTVDYLEVLSKPIKHQIYK